jgi:hypothetical protein
MLVLLLTAVGWKIRRGLERRLGLEEKLRDDRLEVYNQILEPFVVLLMTDAAWAADPKTRKKDKVLVATQSMLSLEYKQNAFKLSLFGGDEVVRAYNNLMQYFFERADYSESATESDVKEMAGLLGAFLLEIRRSVGNETTALDRWEMLEWFMTDARRFRTGTTERSGTA